MNDKTSSIRVVHPMTYFGLNCISFAGYAQGKGRRVNVVARVIGLIYNGETLVSTMEVLRACNLR